MSTVQNTEVPIFERFIYSKKSSVGPRGVHNKEMATLERCPLTEVLLYQVFNFPITFFRYLHPFTYGAISLVTRIFTVVQMIIGLIKFRYFCIEKDYL